MLLGELGIRGLQVHEVTTQGVDPDVMPSIAVYATLKQRLVLACRDKVTITVNGFEHGCDRAIPNHMVE